MPQNPLPSYDATTKILLFFKHFDQVKSIMRFVGSVIVRKDQTFSELIRYCNCFCGLDTETSMTLYEEVRVGPGSPVELRPIIMTNTPIKTLMSGNGGVIICKPISLPHLFLDLIKWATPRLQAHYEKTWVTICSNLLGTVLEYVVDKVKAGGPNHILARLLGPLHTSIAEIQQKMLAAERLYETPADFSTQTRQMLANTVIKCYPDIAQVPGNIAPRQIHKELEEVYDQVWDSSGLILAKKRFYHDVLKALAGVPNINSEQDARVVEEARLEKEKADEEMRRANEERAEMKRKQDQADAEERKRVEAEAVERKRQKLRVAAERADRIASELLKEEEESKAKDAAQKAKKEKEVREKKEAKERQKQKERMDAIEKEEQQQREREAKEKREAEERVAAEKAALELLKQEEAEAAYALKAAKIKEKKALRKAKKKEAEQALSSVAAFDGGEDSGEDGAGPSTSIQQPLPLPLPLPTPTSIPAAPAPPRPPNRPPLPAHLALIYSRSQASSSSTAQTTSISSTSSAPKPGPSSGISMDQARILALRVKAQLSSTPSAPFNASAPPFSSQEKREECVVCMSRLASVVFIPCGHCICCGPCAVKCKKRDEAKGDQNVCILCQQAVVDFRQNKS